MMNTDEKKLDDIVAGINYMDSDFTTEAWRAVAKTAIREGHESEINAAYENALYDHASPKIPTFDEYIASDAGKKMCEAARGGPDGLGYPQGHDAQENRDLAASMQLHEGSTMINTDFEYTLNSLTDADKAVLFDMYSLVKVGIRSASDGEGNPTIISDYFDYQIKKEYRKPFKILKKLHEKEIVQIDEDYSTGVKMYAVSFSTMTIANFETFAAWVKTPSLTVLQSNADLAESKAISARKNADEMRNVVLQRIQALYPDYKVIDYEIAKMKADEAVAAYCTIYLTSKENLICRGSVVEANIPLAVLNSSDPVAAYAEMQRRQGLTKNGAENPRKVLGPR